MTQQQYKTIAIRQTLWAELQQARLKEQARTAQDIGVREWVERLLESSLERHNANKGANRETE